VHEQNLGGIWIDDALGALLQALEDKWIKDDTIIATMVDHGIVTKISLFENGNRVYYSSMRYPGLGTHAANLVYDGHITNFDLVATLLDLCSIPSTSYDFDGKSFRSDLERVVAERISSTDNTLYPSSPVWSGENRCVFAEYKWDSAVRCGCYKYIDISTYPRGTLLSSTTMARGSNSGYSSFNKQIYNVCDDNGESNNLVNSSGDVLDSGNAAILSGLLKALECHDARTAPGQALSFVDCTLEVAVTGTPSPSPSQTPSPTRNPTATPDFTVSPTPSSTNFDEYSSFRRSGWR